MSFLPHAITRAAQKKRYGGAYRAADFEERADFLILEREGPGGSIEIEEEVEGGARHRYGRPLVFDRGAIRGGQTPG